ncbi:hypothetical protein HID58_069359 [Brassica napus]|uniref:Uncharacterized protein n=2 Tax=Brassica TaxID=3705 RepID=A0ABQ7YVM5_BRANA|nr:hypothetical protein HID58_069359 [Brassica napus]
MWMIEIKKKRNPNFSETQIDLGIFLSENPKALIFSWCEEMAKTKFTKNGKEVRRSLRHSDYGVEEAVQQSKKGGKGGDGSVFESKKSVIRGKGGASVSLSSPEKSRKSKRVEGKSMLASTEASKTRRVTSYGSPVSSPERATRRGTPYGGSTLSPRQSKKQKVDGGSTVAPPGNSKKSQVDGDDIEECPRVRQMR